MCIHRRKFLKFRHETTINPVFPLPHPRAPKTEPAARGHGVFVPRADKRKPTRLRAIRFERHATHRAPQILGKRRPHAHREHARFFERVVRHVRNVARRKNARVSHGLQCVGDHDETVFVERETCLAEPRRAACAGDPDNFVGGKRVAVCGFKLANAHAFHGRAAMHDYAALGKHFIKSTANARSVRRQNIRDVGEQMKRDFVGAAPELNELIAQPKLHRKQQFNATRTRAHHRNRCFARVRFHAFQQREPTVIELANRLYRNRVFRRARHGLQLRRGTNIDRQLIVRHRRAISAEHFFASAINADHFVAIQTRAGKCCEATQINVHIVVVVMSRHVARQHAGIRRVHVGANHGEAHAGNRLHAKAFEHADVAVATADQHDVSQNGLVRCLHSEFFWIGFCAALLTSRGDGVARLQSDYKAGNARPNSPNCATELCRCSSLHARTS